MGKILDSCFIDWKNILIREESDMYGVLVC